MLSWERRNISVCILQARPSASAREFCTQPIKRTASRSNNNHSQSSQHFKPKKKEKNRKLHLFKLRCGRGASTNSAFGNIFQFTTYHVVHGPRKHDWQHIIVITIIECERLQHRKAPADLPLEMIYIGAYSVYTRKRMHWVNSYTETCRSFCSTYCNKLKWLCSK